MLAGISVYRFKRRGNSLTQAVRDLWQRKSLLNLWLWFNIEANYTDSKLGLLWVILNPLSMTLVYTIAFSELLGIRGPRGGIPFVSFYLTGITLWHLFNSGVSSSSLIIQRQMSLINQAQFPREILLLSRMGEQLVEFTITFVLMLIINAFNGIWPNQMFVYLPLLLISAIAMTQGIMFIVSPISVFIRDVPQLISSALRLFFFLTPVIYPVELVPEHLRFLVLLNPVALLIEEYRRIILYAELPSINSFGYLLSLSLLILLIGFVFFKSNEDKLADYR
jgi:ABC-type polysaccharide/polyol phosphate export permease